VTDTPPAPPSPAGNLPSIVSDDLPDIIHRSGANAVFAAQEFFFGTIRNEHTRRAYLHAVKLFLAWVENHGGGELDKIAPWHVGHYFEELAKTTSIATRNQHLSALRHFFDGLVTRHAIVLNPALSVRRTLQRNRGQNAEDFHRTGPPTPFLARHDPRHRPARSSDPEALRYQS
jgi:integrase/recombinase XerD